MDLKGGKEAVRSGDVNGAIGLQFELRTAWKSIPVRRISSAGRGSTLHDAVAPSSSPGTICLVTSFGCEVGVFCGVAAHDET